jgi:hypothetical protein
MKCSYTCCNTATISCFVCCSIRAMAVRRHIWCGLAKLLKSQRVVGDFLSVFNSYGIHSQIEYLRTTGSASGLGHGDSSKSSRFSIEEVGVTACALTVKLGKERASRVLFVITTHRWVAVSIFVTSSHVDHYIFFESFLPFLSSACCQPIQVNTTPVLHLYLSLHISGTVDLQSGDQGQSSQWPAR